MKRKKTNKILFVIVIILASLLSLNGMTKIIKENNFFNTSEESSDEVVNASIPNSGYVEKVYFNTNLSVDETNSILNQLVSWGEEDGNGLSSHYVLASVDMSKAIIIQTNSTKSAFLIVGMLSNDTPFLIYDSSNLNGLGEGWANFDNPLTINSEVISNVEGMFFGTENDKIKSLISTNPFN